MKAAPVLIVVTGLPAAGKTTLATVLGRELALPVISKDDYKQVLLDLLPEEERIPRNSEVGRASYFVMLRAADAILTARQSLILETHFYVGMIRIPSDYRTVGTPPPVRPSPGIRTFSHSLRSD